jgi:hypothetical protein
MNELLSKKKHERACEPDLGIATVLEEYCSHIATARDLTILLSEKPNTSMRPLKISITANLPFSFTEMKPALDNSQIKKKNASW